MMERFYAAEKQSTFFSPTVKTWKKRMKTLPPRQSLMKVSETCFVQLGEGAEQKHGQQGSELGNLTSTTNRWTSWKWKENKKSGLDIFWLDRWK